MKTLIALLVLATCAYADDYKVSRPDSFGAQYVTGPNGFRGKISAPDSFGARYFKYNNGVSGKISKPDSFGARRITTTQRR